MPQNSNHDPVNREMAETEKFDSELDAKGLRCPLPLLKVKLKLRELEAGQVLAVSATDPGSAIDIPVFLEKVGHELLYSAEEAGVYSFVIRK